jgi:general secretion pathway protein C
VPEESSILVRLRRWFRRWRTSAFGRKRRGEGQGTSLSLRSWDAERGKDWLRWTPFALTVLGLFLLASMVAGILGLFLRPAPLPLPMRAGGISTGPESGGPPTDFDGILKRNMFNVEGKIPDPFDQGMLDCMSQARRSSARLRLLGTIVMTDDQYSVALIEEEGTNEKYGVRKDETFGGGQYQVMKVDRKRLCFQVKASQEFEYVEIPDEVPALGGGGTQMGLASPMEGVTAVSETDYQIKASVLEKSLTNLNQILQTARAVPYIERETGKFRGFLVQTIEPDSPFAALGIKQGDVLTGVNDIVLDNPGKGLEAFQRLRNATEVKLDVIRNGSKKTMSYTLK